MCALSLSFPREPYALAARIPVALAPGLPGDAQGFCRGWVQVAGGRIAAVGQGAPPPGPLVDAGARLLLPGLVDCHTHIDKGLVEARAPNPDGSFAGALAAAAQDAACHDSEDDLRRRAEFQLRCAHAHGTVALRSHADAHPDRFAHRWGVLRELAQDWRGRLEVQLCPFAGQDAPEGFLERLAAERPDALSLFVQARPELDGFLDRAVALAERHGLALDFHADETTDPQADAVERIAAALIRHRFQGRVLIGHAVALALKPHDVLARIAEMLARTGATVVALPACNLHLMDRQPGRTPRLRGVAPVAELRAAGVPVALASDNVRDPFHAYGDLDMVEIWRDAMRFLQLDHPVADWPQAVAPVPAHAMGLARRGLIAAGEPADLILLPARNWSEFGARPQTHRIVLRAGQPIDPTPPDPAELDGLPGMEGRA